MEDLSKYVVITADEPPLFSVVDKVFGALDDAIEARVQNQLKEDFFLHCRQKLGKDMSERIRELIALDTYGPAHVHSLVKRHIEVIGLGAHVDVPTGATHPTQDA
jgi:hypothetical protein